MDQPSSCDFVAVESCSVVAEDSRQAKVGDLELSCATNEQVSWLQVTMHNVIVVAERHAFQQHQHVALYLHININTVQSNSIIYCQNTRFC